MTDKFLPGPWFVSRDPRPDMEWNNHIASVEHPHLEVCSMFHTEENDNEQGEANARLVAAAPDLLNGCRALVGLLQLVTCRDDISPELQDVLRGNHRIAEALAAIEKAVDPVTYRASLQTLWPKGKASREVP